jgi:uncharacterized protein YuzE
MIIEVAGTRFDYHDYDRRGDTLFLSVGGPRHQPPRDAFETPEGHVVEYDERGELVAVELMNVRWTLEREGELTITWPQKHRVPSAALDPLLAAA